MSEDGKDRFYLCVTCGKLKHESLYEREGACTCDDCKRGGRGAVNFKEAPDGEGFITTTYEGNSRTEDTDTEQSQEANRHD